MPAKIGTPIAIVLAIVAAIAFVMMLTGCESPQHVTIPTPPVTYPTDAPCSTTTPAVPTRK